MSTRPVLQVLVAIAFIGSAITQRSFTAGPNAVGYEWFINSRDPGCVTLEQAGLPGTDTRLYCPRYEPLSKAIDDQDDEFSSVPDLDAWVKISQCKFLNEADYDASDMRLYCPFLYPFTNPQNASYVAGPAQVNGTGYLFITPDCEIYPDNDDEHHEHCGRLFPTNTTGYSFGAPEPYGVAYFTDGIPAWTQYYYFQLFPYPFLRIAEEFLPGPVDKATGGYQWVYYTNGRKTISEMGLANDGDKRYFANILYPHDFNHNVRFIPGEVVSGINSVYYDNNTYYTLEDMGLPGNDTRPYMMTIYFHYFDSNAASMMGAGWMLMLLMVMMVVMGV